MSAMMKYKSLIGQTRDHATNERRDGEHEECVIIKEKI